MSVDKSSFIEKERSVQVDSFIRWPQQFAAGKKKWNLKRKKQTRDKLSNYTVDNTRHTENEIMAMRWLLLATTAPSGEKNGRERERESDYRMVTRSVAVSLPIQSALKFVFCLLFSSPSHLDEDLHQHEDYLTHLFFHGLFRSFFTSKPTNEAGTRIISHFDKTIKHLSLHPIPSCNISYRFVSQSGCISNTSKHITDAFAIVPRDLKEFDFPIGIDETGAQVDGKAEPELISGSWGRG